MVGFAISGVSVVWMGWLLMIVVLGLGLRFAVGSLVNSVGGLVSGCVCYLFDFVLGLLLCC